MILILFDKHNDALFPKSLENLATEIESTSLQIGYLQHYPLVPPTSDLIYNPRAHFLYTAMYLT